MILLLPIAALYMGNIDNMKALMCKPSAHISTCVRSLPYVLCIYCMVRLFIIGPCLSKYMKVEKDN